MTVRFIHTADLQLGKSFGRYDDDVRAQLQDARFTTWQRLLELARDRSVDFVLVAGDLFDASTVAGGVIAKAGSIIEAVGVPVFALPGNHDPLGPGGVWERREFRTHVPDELLHVIDGTEPIGLPGGEAVLVATPWLRGRRNAGMLESIAGALDEVAADRVVVGMAHGSVERFATAPDDDKRGGETSEFLDLDQLRGARVDYLALGDWHGCKQIDHRTWYAGAPEPDRFKDNEPGYVLAVEIDAPGAQPHVERVHVGRFRWKERKATLRSTDDLAALRRSLDAIEGRHDTLLRLELDGSLTVRDRAELDVRLEDLRAQLRYLRLKDAALSVAPSAEEMAELPLPGFLGEAVDELRDAAESPEPDQAETARDALALLYQLHAEVDG